MLLTRLPLSTNKFCISSCVELQNSLKDRSTCMPNPRRQRSLWARIKLSEKFRKICMKALMIYNFVPHCELTLITPFKRNYHGLAWLYQLSKERPFSAFCFAQIYTELPRRTKKITPTITGAKIYFYAQLPNLFKCYRLSTTFIFFFTIFSENLPWWWEFVF